MNFGLARLGALSARRDNVLAGWAGCVLGEHISDLSSFRVPQPAKRVVCLAKRMPLADRICFAKPKFTYSRLASLQKLKGPRAFITLRLAEF